MYISVYLTEIYIILSFERVLSVHPPHYPAICDQPPGVLARWPLHGALAQDVDMKVLYGLLAVFARIDHAAVAVLQSFLSADVLDLEHHVSHELSMISCKVVERGNVDLRYHQHVHWRLRSSVAEHSYKLILVDHVCRDLTIREFAENAVIHVC